MKLRKRCHRRFLTQDKGFIILSLYKQLEYEEKKGFFVLFFLLKGWQGAAASAVICWLPNYWFNCLFSSQACLFIDLWWASDWAHCMHANSTCHEPQLPLSLNTSLISLYLMSGTRQSWQVQKNPPLHRLPQSFLLYYSVYWHAKGCEGSAQIYAKKCSLLADDCQLNHSLGLDPRGQLEPLGHCTVNAKILKWPCPI